MFASAWTSSSCGAMSARVRPCQPGGRRSKERAIMSTKLKKKKILVTGPTGQVALPVTLALAQSNDVWGVARFSDAAARQRLTVAGSTCAVHDIPTDNFRGLPANFDYWLDC